MPINAYSKKEQNQHYKFSLLVLLKGNQYRESKNCADVMSLAFSCKYYSLNHTM